MELCGNGARVILTQEAFFLHENVRTTYLRTAPTAYSLDTYYNKRKLGGWRLSSLFLTPPTPPTKKKVKRAFEFWAEKEREKESSLV